MSKHDCENCEREDELEEYDKIELKNLIEKSEILANKLQSQSDKLEKQLDKLDLSEGDYLIECLANKMNFLIHDRCKRIEDIVRRVCDMWDERMSCIEKEVGSYLQKKR